MGNLSAADNTATQNAAAASGVPLGLLYAVQGAETGNETNPDLAVSSTGAQGLFQVLPSTGAIPGYGVTPIYGGQLNNPTDNANFAASYLSALYNRFGNWNSAINAYTSGNSTVAGGYTYAQLQRQYPQWFDANGTPLSAASMSGSMGTTGSAAGTSIYGTPLPAITSDQVGVAGMLATAQTQMSSGVLAGTVNSVMNWIGSGVLQGATVMIGLVLIVVAFIFLIVESKTVQTSAAALARVA